MFEEASQNTTISSLSEKSKEETGISLQVNITETLLFVILFILYYYFIIEMLETSFDFQTDVTVWAECPVRKLTV